MEVKINDKEYTLERDNNGYDAEVVANALTDYYDTFDYVFGDWAYGKLRLKGFLDSNNKNVKKMNDIKNIDTYIKDYCAYGCKYFLLKRKK